jgi:hypothetical protein
VFSANSLAKTLGMGEAKKSLLIRKPLMKTIRNAPIRALALLLALAAFTLLAGCDVDSVDSTSAILSDDSGTIYNFSGLYMNPGNSTSTNGVLPIVFPNQGNHKPTGELIRSLRVLQYGSVLEGYDSAGLTWYGSISGLQGTTAHFTLSGRTTVGNPVEVAGTMNYADQQSTLNATWIEPNYYGSLIATATVTPASTNTPVSGLTVSSSRSSIGLNETAILTATGGSSTYTWDTPSYGTILSSGSGIASYERTSGSVGGSETITVRSGGDAASTSISFN